MKIIKMRTKLKIAQARVQSIWKKIEKFSRNVRKTAVHMSKNVNLQLYQKFEKNC